MKYSKISIVILAIVVAMAFETFAMAQPPGRDSGGRGPGAGGPGGPGRGGPGRGNAATTLEAFVAKWLTMDANSDGQLSTGELKDDRLKHLFKSSDKNSDGILTKEEMKILFESTNNARSQDGGRGGPEGRGGPGGPEGRSPRDR